jgi:hypothetical protein
MTREQVEIISHRIQNYFEQISGQKLPIIIEPTTSDWLYAFVFVKDNNISVDRISMDLNPSPVYYDCQTLYIFSLKIQPESNQSIQDYLRRNFYHQPINYLRKTR